jgi:hypothetical protein
MTADERKTLLRIVYLCWNLEYFYNKVIYIYMKSPLVHF